MLSTLVVASILNLLEVGSDLDKNTSCRGCGVELVHGIRERHSRVWCSERCRLRYYRATHPRYCEDQRVKNRESGARRYDAFVESRKPVEVECKTCGKVFEARRKDAKYCSASCKYRNYHRLRKDRIHSSVREPYLLSDIAFRDGFVCGLCGEVVDMVVSYPDPSSASVDHVVPLSRGGCDTLDNVQIAHLGCNLRKGSHCLEWQ